MPLRLLMLLPCLLTLGACADPARNLYEGVKARNEAQRTPFERAARPAPDYDTYQRERATH